MLLICFLLTLLALQPSESLALPFEAFDQDLKGGWRVLADEGRYLEAARLIDRYAEVNKAGLTPDELQLLNFHSGQLYAMADSYDIAKKRFSNSYEVSESGQPDWYKLYIETWNAYVTATVAFLSDDLEVLKLQRAKMVRGATHNGEVLNLRIVDNLIRGFGRPYKDAYTNSK